jgi:hypothetical protein
MQTYNINYLENRRYIIFNISELNIINFEQVLETSKDTVLKSVDGTKTFVKWEGEMPTCVQNLTTKEGPYSHSEILQILDTDEWAQKNPLTYD